MVAQAKKPTLQKFVDDYEAGLQVQRRGDEIQAVLLYPPYEDDQNSVQKPRYVTVDLEHVRAADGVRVSFHFGRNGWLIEQAQVFEWPSDDPVCDPQWKEVAFVEAWASQKVPAGD